MTAKNNNSISSLHSEIKRTSIVQSVRDGMLIGLLMRQFSYWCSAWFVKLHLKPNFITLLMIIFGIIGSAFFALPYLWAKICGYIFWYLWFTMDLSDGQVARFTKTYSKYGKEMDYMAHLIDHSCMNFALWLSFIELGGINPIIVSAAFIICISCELINRNLISFYVYIVNINNPREKSTTPQPWISYILDQVVLYPTFILTFPLIFIAGMIFSISTWYIFLVWLVYSFLRCIINFAGLTKYFYNS